MRPRLFIFGLGYVGLRVAQQAVERGFKVSGSVRLDEAAPARIEALAAAGIAGCTFDLDGSYTGAPTSSAAPNWRSARALERV